EFLGAHSNHTKTILIDDRISIVGSYNLDMRSTYLNTELMLVIDCEELNRQYRRQAEEDKGWCKSIAAGEEYQFGTNYQPREFSFFKKIFYAVLRLLIIPIRRLL
ncbi:MAG: phospholipase D-like domain-containing protein, partial [Lachnospiraceae bacterium]|nr:phospholipase D-like domain-containing protein [Lachnospiraceae bacterium]